MGQASCAQYSCKWNDNFAKGLILFAYIKSKLIFLQSTGHVSYIAWFTSTIRIFSKSSSPYLLDAVYLFAPSFPSSVTRFQIFYCHLKSNIFFMQTRGFKRQKMFTRRFSPFNKLPPWVLTSQSLPQVLLPSQYIFISLIIKCRMDKISQVYFMRYNGVSSN